MNALHKIILLSANIAVAALSLGAGEIEFSFLNGYDRTSRKAVAYIPEQSVPPAQPRPLLVIAHYMGGNRFTAGKLGYYREAERRNWLLVCPDLHGKRTPGATSCAALEAQHDIIAAIDHMKSQYAVDEQRIYITGRSMGGALAQMMLSKYPDLFAAGVAGEGISDFEHFTSLQASVEAAVTRELGAKENNLFEYRRRSSIHYAANLAHVPMILWHGSNDMTVPVEQSLKLHEAISRHTLFPPPLIIRLLAGHDGEAVSVSWICDQLAEYRNVSDSYLKVKGRAFRSLALVTDEDKSFFWVSMQRADPGCFGSITAQILPEKVLKMSLRNLKKVVVDQTLISPLFPFSAIEFDSDYPETRIEIVPPRPEIDIRNLSVPVMRDI